MCCKTTGMRLASEALRSESFNLIISVVVTNAKGFKVWNFELLFEGFVSESLRKEIKTNNDGIILNPKLINTIWKDSVEIILEK